MFTLVQIAAAIFLGVLIFTFGVPKNRAVATWFVGFGLLVSLLSFGACSLFGYGATACVALQKSTRLVAGEVIGYPLTILGIIGLLRLWILETTMRRRA